MCLSVAPQFKSRPARIIQHELQLHLSHCSTENTAMVTNKAQIKMDGDFCTSSLQVQGHHLPSPMLKHLLCTNRSGHDATDIFLRQTIQTPERRLERRGKEDQSDCGEMKCRGQKPSDVAAVKSS